MFSSPSIRLYNSENVDNLVQRKPGNSLTTRKPFLDRSVNSKTPDTGKLLKPKLKLPKETAAAGKPKISPKTTKVDLNAEDFMFSYKDVEDTYEDIWPKICLNTEDLVRILRNYCSTEDTPPPSPEPLDINPMFFDLPEMEMPKLPDEDVFNITFDDVEIPQLDYEDLDRSL